MSRSSRRPARRTASLSRTAVLATVPVALAALLATATPAAAGTTGAAGAGDPYFPLAGNGGYDVRHYDLTLRYDTRDRHLDGRATLTARATQRLTRFDLDLTGLNVTGVTVDHARAGYRRDGQELVVTPRHALRAGQSFRVTVTYQGTPKPVTDPDGSPDGWIPTDDGAFVAGEPQGAMTWFPANNHPTDKASYDFTLTVPEGRTAVANGVLLGTRTEHGTTTFRWHQAEPMAAYLATATIGAFRVRQYTTRDGIRVYDAVDPREAAAAEPVLQQLPAVLTWESGLFGPYPFRAAGSIVDHAPDVGYALETQTRPVYDSAPDVDTLVHESAHQWFGDSVSLTTWKDIWLNEGFASYMEHRWTEDHGGATTSAWLHDEYDAWRSTSGFWQVDLTDPGPNINTQLFDQAVYERGAMALAALRNRIGRHTFDRLLRHWAADHRYGSATVGMFEHAAAKAAGHPLDRFFHAWLVAKQPPRRTAANGL